MLFPIIVCSPFGGESRLTALNSEQCALDKGLSYVITVFNVISDLYLFPIPISVGGYRWQRFDWLCGLEAVSAECLPRNVASNCNRQENTMWATVPMLISSGIEINVGIIVGRMPHLTFIFRLSSTRLMRFSPLSHLQPGISPYTRWLKMFKKSSKPPNDSPTITSDDEGHDAFLKTKILGSMNGKGVFALSTASVDSTERKMQARWGSRAGKKSS